METQAKTLVILTPGFPANEADSTCVPPQQIFVKALKEVNPELNIVVLTFQYPFISKIYRWHGIKVIAFGSPADGRIHRLYTGLRVWLALRRLNRDQHLIGLLSFWVGKCALIGSGFAKKHGLKHYGWLLGQDAKAGNKYISRINPTDESLIALSDFVASEFQKNYGIKPQHLIPVGIDTTMFSEAIAERDIDIFGAGSFIPLKQYAVFLEVVAGLKPMFPNLKAVIGGDGPQMKLLRQLIKTLDIADNITLVGRLTHAEVLATMQRSKVFLHPSNYEGFGAVCLEALYAGAKVVSVVQPMDKPITNWHIAKDKLHMVQIIQELLSNQNPCYQPVLPFTIKDNARAMLKLFL